MADLVRGKSMIFHGTRDFAYGVFIEISLVAPEVNLWLGEEEVMVGERAFPQGLCTTLIHERHV